MNKLIKFLKEYALLYDIINTLLGIALIIFMILFFVNPKNHVILFVAFLIGGSMNIINGLKFMKDPKKKNIGMSSVLLGAIIIFVGYALMLIKPAF